MGSNPNDILASTYERAYAPRKPFTPSPLNRFDAYDPNSADPAAQPYSGHFGVMQPQDVLARRVGSPEWAGAHPESASAIDAAGAPPPAPAIERRMGPLHPEGLVGPSYEELGAGAMMPSIRQHAYDPSSLPDWSGHTDASGARSVDMGSLSQAQIGQDINARGMLNARNAGELESMRQQAGQDPQDAALHGIERTAQYEALMPNIERPLQGKGGEFQMGAGGAITGGGAVSRTRMVDPQLALYGGQKAIDRQGDQDKMFQYQQVDALEAMAMDKLRKDPRYASMTPEERANYEAKTRTPFEAQRATLDRVHGRISLNTTTKGQQGPVY